MRRYPIKKSVFAPPKSAEEAEFIKAFTQTINDAFYTGFELGVSGNIEEFKAITPGQRCILVACAKKMMDALFPDEPGKSSMEGESSVEETAV